MTRRSRGLFEGTLESLGQGTMRILAAEGVAGRKGLLQPIDPRAKLIGLLALVLAAAFSHNPWIIAALFAVAVALAALSRVPMASLLSLVWLGSLGLTLGLALPALVLTPGQEIARLPLVGWAITRPGLVAALRLVLRVETVATLGFVLVFTTPWAHVLKALRFLRVPVVFVVILGMTTRYILLILEAARDMFEARRSRSVGRLDRASERRVTLNAAGALLQKSLDLSGDVFLAMQARGFRGEVHVLDDFRMTGRDWLATTGFVALAAFAAWMGR